MCWFKFALLVRHLRTIFSNVRTIEKDAFNPYEIVPIMKV